MSKDPSLIPTLIAGLWVAESSPRLDNRGTFSRFFCQETLGDALGGRQIIQINHSCTTQRGAVRGLHFQHAPHAEMKLVRCLRGKVWDVAVDLRLDSPTFLQWFATELTPANARMMIIPEGCAHGFQSLEPDSELLYLHTAAYSPMAEGGIHHADARLKIAWPLPVTDLSQRDRQLPYIESDFAGVRL